MTYIYQTEFDIESDQTHHMQLGKSLGLSLAYMRALLPDEPGYVSSRAMVLLRDEDQTHIVLESSWTDWESLSAHLDDSLLREEVILPKFDLPVELQNLKTFIFEEVV